MPTSIRSCWSSAWLSPLAVPLAWPAAVAVLRTRNRINQNIHAKIIGDGGTESERPDRRPAGQRACQRHIGHSQRLGCGHRGGRRFRSRVRQSHGRRLVIGKPAEQRHRSFGVQRPESAKQCPRCSGWVNRHRRQPNGDDQCGQLERDLRQRVLGRNCRWRSAVGARADNTINNRMEASVDSSNVPMSVTVNAISNNDIDAIIKSGTASVSAAQIAGGAAAVGVVTASNTVGDLPAKTTDQRFRSSPRFAAAICPAAANYESKPIRPTTSTR